MTDHLFETQIVLTERVNLSNPVVVGGFVGPGLAGLVSASYMIEQLGLHQIAHVKSQHLPPVAVFIGEKLRHPFRIYSDKEGRLVVIICEVPIDVEGLYEISNVLLNWFEQIKAREVVILDALPINGIPADHESFFVAEESKFDDMKKRGIGLAQSAMIGGVGGAILSECLSRRVSGVSLLTQASINLPDPGASLTLIRSLNSIYQFGIATKELEANVEELNKQLNVIGEQYRRLQEQAQRKEGQQPEAMYR